MVFLDIFKLGFWKVYIYFNLEEFDEESVLNILNMSLISKNEKSMFVWWNILLEVCVCFYMGYINGLKL